MTLAPIVITSALGVSVFTLSLLQAGQPVQDASVTASAEKVVAAARQYRDQHCAALSTQTGLQLATAGYLDSAELTPSASHWAVSFNAQRQGSVAITPATPRMHVLLREFAATATRVRVEVDGEEVELLSVRFPLGYRKRSAIGAGGYLNEAADGPRCGQ